MLLLNPELQGPSLSTLKTVSTEISPQDLQGADDPRIPQVPAQSSGSTGH